MTDMKAVTGGWNELGPLIAPLRKKVFLEEQGVPEDEVFDGLDGRAVHALIQENGAAVAAARMHENRPGNWQINWVVTAKERRGRGFGAAVMAALLEEARRRGGRSASLGAQEHAVPFYEKLGFRPNGHEIRYPSGFVILGMEKELSASR